MLLSIVVPVFNEEDNIQKFYTTVKDVLQTLDYDHEIIFVDDGSSDDCAGMLRYIGNQDPKV